METKNNNKNHPEEFQIIFDKLEDAKKENAELFLLNSENVSALSESIREIQKIVDSYSSLNTFTTFTKV